jgi:hypothetical protein
MIMINKLQNSYGEGRDIGGIGILIGTDEMYLSFSSLKRLCHEKT